MVKRPHEPGSQQECADVLTPRHPSHNSCQYQAATSLPAPRKTDTCSHNANQITAATSSAPNQLYSCNALVLAVQFCVLHPPTTAVSLHLGFFLLLSPQPLDLSLFPSTSLAHHLIRLSLQVVPKNMSEAGCGAHTWTLDRAQPA